MTKNNKHTEKRMWLVTGQGIKIFAVEILTGYIIRGLQSLQSSQNWTNNKELENKFEFYNFIILYFFN